MGRRWSTITEAAEYFGISRKTLYSLAARHRLPSGSVLRIGRQIRIDVQKIEQAAEGIGKCR
jgi:excisionase family DNA binding protein